MGIYFDDPALTADGILQTYPTPQPNLFVYSKEKDDWQPVIGTLDCGTPDAWIGEHLLERLGPQEEVEVTPQLYVDFQGQPFSSTRAVKLLWCSAKRRESREGIFRVMENGPFDLILGSNFLFSKGILIFREAALLFYHRNPEPGKHCHF